MIRRNSARCCECGDEIVSAHRHDFRHCTCGALSVDGGRDYLRRLWTPGIGWEETSDADDEDLR